MRLDMHFPPEVIAGAYLSGLVAASLVLLVVALIYIHKGLLHLLLPKMAGYREWYRIVFRSEQLASERRRRQWYRKQDGEWYRRWVVGPDGVLLRVIERPPLVHFAGTGVPLTWNEVMNRAGYIADARGEWVRLEEKAQGEE